MSATFRTPSRRSVSALVAVAALGLAACSGSSAATNPPASAAAASAGSAAPSIVMPSATASMSVAPSSSAAPASNPPASGPTAVPTSLDPCQLITSQEAGQLAGASYGPGKEVTTSGNSKICTYGAQTKNVFNVIVAVSPDVATAKKAEAAAEADQEKNAAEINQGLVVTKMPGFTSDSDAVLMELKPNSLGISGRAIYVLRGTVFFGFSDLVLGGSAPSADAMKAEAMTVLGRLP